MKIIQLRDSDDRLVKLFRALGHPARLRIVRILADRQTCVCGEIVDELPLSQATVSQHLSVLKDAGIIVGEIDGPAVCYCLAPGALGALHEAVALLSADVGQAAQCCPSDTTQSSKEVSLGIY